jgi:molybdenum cofactor synthesis domain-containing protein
VDTIEVSLYEIGAKTLLTGTRFTVGVLTISDKASRGERIDESGKCIAEILAGIGGQVVVTGIVPDEPDNIASTLKQWADELEIAVVLTTGGTGFSPRDITPEATRTIIEREAPGLAESMRAVGRDQTPRAMLSRGVAGIRNRTLIINLPGSLRGAQESLAVILPVLPHAVEILTGKPTDHS